MDSQYAQLIDRFNEIATRIITAPESVSIPTMIEFKKLCFCLSLAVLEEWVPRETFDPDRLNEIAAAIRNWQEVTKRQLTAAKAAYEKGQAAWN